jgi:hypothetical protein
LRHHNSDNFGPREAALLAAEPYAEPEFRFPYFLADDYREETTIMIIKTTSLAFAATCLMAISALPAAHAQMATGPQVVTNGPQTDSGDVSPSWSARRNVIDSGRYDRLLQTSPAFRHARMQKECGPITDTQLHADCLASFDENVGSSTGPGTYPSGSGR